ncbi:antirepressor regulating drug resistance protein (plasmid) [Mycolicibacterium chubuense NBB4]|uniref:Antirepressor regulating drug resistance protein n=2 Tax=Mycolicibacterium chubuense TaxID=1800 RepID=I4BSS5_MYCCN|nr:antirepressor regulating drug resistance protein [Mycolicibacterium chubuense NBB4]
MNMAVCLLAYALSLTVLGPGVLSRFTRAGAAPRFAIGAWLAVMGSVLVAAVAAAALFVGQTVVSWGRIGPLLTGCMAGLGMIARGGYGQLVQVAVLALAAVSTLAVMTLGARAALALRRMRRGTHDHGRAVRIATGNTPPGPGGTFVLDSDRRGVYCLAGRPYIIVITRAALDALNDAQLAAVLAHERAHLRGRHHQVLALTGALSKLFPRVRLFTQGAGDVARLLEMCADDVAARRHSPDTVVDALLALSLPTPAIAPATPAAALGAAGLAVAQRVERLLFRPNGITARIGLMAATVAALLGPVLAISLMIAQPGMACI